MTLTPSGLPGVPGGVQGEFSSLGHLLDVSVPGCRVL